MRNFSFVLIGFLFFSCSKPKTQEQSVIDNQQVRQGSLSVNISDGKAIVTIGDKKQMIQEEGEIMDYSASEDGRFIIFDVSVLSTLNVIKLYQYDAVSKLYAAEKDNINTKVWQIFYKKHKINPEEMNSSRIHFLNWSGRDSVAVELNADIYTGESISDTLILGVR